ncbi:MAG TPA: glycine betaine ABC transporter substrate-binding protein, partial [SAR324 cluster bacterium]|nr:glycine betaine ABC transporter substrate-binding protein [SAR324 cluster bacterium]
KWPGAYKAIRNFKVDNAEMGDMIGRIDLDGSKLEKVVAGWMKSNQSRWKAWIK